MTTSPDRNPAPGDPPPERSRVHLLLDWARTADAPLSIFLGMIVLSTVLSWPLWQLLPRWTFNVLFVSTVVFGLVALVPSPRLAILAGLLGAAAMAQRLGGSEHITTAGTATSLAFFLVVGMALLRRVFRPGNVTVHRLIGAVALFVVLAVTWGFAYQVLVLLQPGALLVNGLPARPEDAMWFSFVTITTVGFGDVIPVLPVARSLAGLEALTGVLYPAVLIGMLLSDFGRSAQKDRREP